MIEIFDLPAADIHVPFQYWSGSVLTECAWLTGGLTPRTFWRCPVGDLIFECALVKGVGEHGWYLKNPRLAAPGTQELHDFPLADVLHFGIMRALFFLTPSWGAVLNIYYLAGFPLAAWCALLVLRSLGLSYVVSIPTAVLFAFTPYHLQRAQAHLQLASCYLIPLATWLVLTAWNVPEPQGLTSSTNLGPSRSCALRVAAVSILIASSGTYYAFFTCYFLVVAAVAAFLHRRSWHALLRPAVPLLIIVVVFILQLLPTVAYQHQNGPNELVARRQPQESETYGLKIAQLLLPIQHHRFAPFAAIRSAYDRASPLINENGASSLGLLGAVGFTFLVLATLVPSIGHRTRPLLNQLATLNLAAVLLGTIGGFGALFAWLVSPQIRAYNRISVFIAFFALTATACLADVLWRQPSHTPKRRSLVAAIALVVATIGLLDQTSHANRPSHLASQSDFYRERQYFLSLESFLPDGAMVLQIPHQTYPEPGPQHNMAPYDPLRPYLHTKHLRFSAGAVRGRYWDAWLSDLFNRHPLPQALHAAAIAGFAAVLLDRYGLNAHAKNTEQLLLETCGPPFSESPDGRYLAFDLRPLAARWSRFLKPELLAEIREHMLRPLMVQWRGFYPPERTGDVIWRWARWYGELKIFNPSGRRQTLEFTAGFFSGAPTGCALRIEGPGFREVMHLKGGQETFYRRQIVVSPGYTVLCLRADGPALVSPGDPRTLVFRIVNPRFELAASVRSQLADLLLAPRVLEVNTGYERY